MTDIGSRFTNIQARTLGAFGTYTPHGQNKGAGVVNYTSTNGVANDDITTTILGHDGTADEHAGSAIAARPSQISSGKVVIFPGWRTNDVPGTGIENEMTIGAVERDPIDGDINNFAGYRPETAEVGVLSDGTLTTQSVTYPSVDTLLFYTPLVIDYDEGETRFYMENNPFVDDPVATISDTPNELGPIGALMGPGPSSFENLSVAHTGVLYVM